MELAVDGFDWSLCSSLRGVASAQRSRVSHGRGQRNHTARGVAPRAAEQGSSSGAARLRARDSAPVPWSRNSHVGGRLHRGRRARAGEGVAHGEPARRRAAGSPVMSQGRELTSRGRWAAAPDVRRIAALVRWEGDAPEQRRPYDAGLNEQMGAGLLGQQELGLQRGFGVPTKYIGAAGRIWGPN